MHNKKLLPRAISIIVITLLVCTVLPGQSNAQDNADASLNMTELWNADYSKGEFTHGIFGDFNGDSTADFMAIYTNESVGYQEFDKSYLILFDGQDASILWEKEFTDNVTVLYFGDLVDKEGGQDVLVVLFELEEVPVQNTNSTYNRTIHSTARVNGSNGDIIWTNGETIPLQSEHVQIGNEEKILMAGYGEYSSTESGLYVLNPDSGIIQFTGIQFSPYFYSFVIDKLPNGDEIIAVYGDRAVEAYSIDDWSLIWEYDFFDNEIYHGEGWSGLMGGEGTVGFQARKGDITLAMVVLDSSSGDELFVTDLTDTEIFSPSIFRTGQFNGDGYMDYLSLGYTNYINTTLCAINGRDGSIIWKQDIPFDVFGNQASTLKIIDMNADGNDDIFLILDSNVLSLSGSTGETLWETSLPHEPDIILTGDLDDSESPNIVYAHNDTIYMMYLDIPDASDQAQAISIGIIVVLAMVSIIALVIIRNKRKAPPSQ